MQNLLYTMAAEDHAEKQFASMLDQYVILPLVSALSLIAI